MATVFRPPFYTPRPGPGADLWQGAPVAQQPATQINHKTAFRSPFYAPNPPPGADMWVGAPISEPQVIWTYIAQTMFGAPGQGPTKLWRWDHVPEPVWQGAPVAAPVLADFAAYPFIKKWRYDLVPEPDWYATPIEQPNAITLLTELSGGQVPTKFWHWDFPADPIWQALPAASQQLEQFITRPFTNVWQANFAETTAWAWAPPDATIRQVVPVTNPFARFWRYDTVFDAVWQGAPAPAPVLADFSQYPFATQWQPNLAELTSWNWAPLDLTINLPIPGSPPGASAWQYNSVPDPVWQGGPVLSGVLANFSAVPFAQQWRWDHVPEPVWYAAPTAALIVTDFAAQPVTVTWRLDVAEFMAWAWTPPSPPGAIPFTRMLHYDLVYDAEVWLGAPSASPMLYDFATKPFAKMSRFDTFEPPVWAWAPPNAIAVYPFPGPGKLSFRAPFYAPRPPPGADLWQGAPTPSPVQIDSSIKPFAKFWRWDFVPEVVWQGSPTISPILADNATRPFQKLWRWDVFEPPIFNWTASASIELFGNFAQGLIVFRPPLYAPRPGLETSDLWAGAPLSKPAFIVGTKPFTRYWRWDHVPAPDWAWAPPNATLPEVVWITLSGAPSPRPLRPLQLGAGLNRRFQRTFDVSALANLYPRLASVNWIFQIRTFAGSQTLLLDCRSGGGLSGSGCLVTYYPATQQIVVQAPTSALAAISQGFYSYGFGFVPPGLDFEGAGFGTMNFTSGVTQAMVPGSPAAPGGSDDTVWTAR